MKLFDSLSGQQKELNKKFVSMYSCDQTVYNYIHIGNARPLIITDVLYRYLKSINDNVKFIMNITDIDDKIIEKSLVEKISDMEVAKKFQDFFLQNVKDLNVLMPDQIIPISKVMNTIIEFVNDIVETGS